jgi:hypothetical protein
VVVFYTLYFADADHIETVSCRACVVLALRRVGGGKILDGHVNSHRNEWLSVRFVLKDIIGRVLCQGELEVIRGAGGVSRAISFTFPV